MNINRMAFDRSLRSYQDFVALDRALTSRTFDADGHMRVLGSAVSKSNVCGYMGSEIPDYRSLGLNPDRIYQLLRDPSSLANAARSLNGKPLMIVHRSQTATDHKRQAVVGAVVHARGQAHEHLGRIVQRLGDLAAQQGGHQRQALAFHHAAEVGGAERSCLSCELAHFPVRHARDRFVHDRLPAQPGEVGKIVVAMASACPFQHEFALAHALLRRAAA